MKAGNILNFSPFGYAYHEIITDDTGKPVDYRFLEVNPAFEKQNRLKGDEIIGKTVTEVLPGIEEENFNLIEFYGKVAIEGGNEVFEQYSEPFDKWYQVHVFSDEKGYFATVFMDISKLKEAEEKKSFKNALLSAQQEASIDGILAVDKDGKAILHNTRFAEIWELPPDILATKSDELMLKAVKRLLVDSEIFMDKVKYLYDHTQESSRDEILLNDGRVLDRFSSPMFGSENQYYGRVWFFRDITEWKKTEEELQKSKNQVEAILANIPAVIFSYTIDSNGELDITYLNDNVTKILGFKPDDFIGNTEFFKSCIHPDDRKLSVEKTQELLSERFIEMEYRFIDKDGDYHWIFDRHSVISQKDGVTEVLGVWVDITERKQAEEALQNEKNKLHSIIDAMEDGLTFQDKDFNIIFQNRVANYYLPGIGGKCYKVYEGRDTICPGCPVKLAYEDGKSHISERKTVIPSGEILFWENVANPIRNSKGEIIACLEINRNITERKRVEAKLQEAKKDADAANKSKSEFLANMSHEIRTPLNAVIGLTRLMLTDKDLNTKQRETLLKINNSSKLLLGIINDILDYSKIEAGKLEMDYHPFSLNEILDNLRSIFNDKISEKGLDFYYDISSDIPGILLGDSLRLSQVITNLLGNSLKFTEKGHVELRIKKIREDDKQCILRFEVTDTGKGISEEDQERLFQAFTQADTSTTRKYGGTGLGLVISNKILELMKGELRLESAPGKGSNFFFEIPFEIISKQTLFNPEKQKKFSGMKTLIVDDQEIARNTLYKILESWNMSAVVASSGREAVDAVIKADEENSPFGLILMDWKMPGELNGIQAISEIRCLNKNGVISSSDIPVFIVSAYQRGELDEVKHGFDALLYKPVTASSFFETLNTIIGSESSDIQTKGETIGIPCLSGYSILLAEDNETNKDVALRWLERTSVSIDVANDGKEAVRMSEEKEYDLILMDLQMPNMDGFDAAELIRSKKPELPIIALSAAVMESDVRKSKDAGMNGHIKKPIDETELYQTLSKWLNVERILKEDYTEKKEDDTSSIPELKGFDTEIGLKSVDNDNGFYKQMLLKFKRQLASDFNNVISIVKDGDEQAPSMIHTLKGLSGVVRAINLHEIIVEIDAAYKSSNAITATMIKKLEDALYTAQSSLKKISDTEKREVREVDENEARNLIQAMKASLEQSEVIDDELLLTVCTYFEKFYGKGKARKLKEYVENFDYDNALELLNEGGGDE
jgi:two-component system sensor histidine kinase/response regulator